MFLQRYKIYIILNLLFITLGQFLQIIYIHGLISVIY